MLDNVADTLLKDPVSKLKSKLTHNSLPWKFCSSKPGEHCPSYGGTNCGAAAAADKDAKMKATNSINFIFLIELYDKINLFWLKYSYFSIDYQPYIWN